MEHPAQTPEDKLDNTHNGSSPDLGDLPSPEPAQPTEEIPSTGDSPQNLDTDSVSGTPGNPTTTAEASPKSDKEITLRQETGREKLNRLIINVAVQTRAAERSARAKDTKGELSGKMNGAEHSFAILGAAVGDIKTFDDESDIDISAPTIDFQKVFNKPGEPKPRVMVQQGVQRAVYDRRVDPSKASNLTKGVYELQAVYAKVRKEDGSVEYYCAADYVDDKNKVQREFISISEGVFIDSYMLAQHAVIQRGLADEKAGTHGLTTRLAEDNVRGLLNQVTVNSAAYATDSLSASKPVELEHGLEPAILSKEADGVLRLTAEEFTGWVSKLKNQLTGDENKLTRSRLDTYIQAATTGKDTISSESVFDVLVIAGQDEMRKQIGLLNTKISTLETQLTTEKDDKKREDIAKEIKIKKNEKRLLEKLSKGQRRENPVYDLFRDIDEGRCDSKIAKKVMDSILSSERSMEFFRIQQDDMEDPNSLIRIITDHYLAKAGYDDDEKRTAWIKDFLSKHGQEIVLMGVYTFIQLISGIIGDAARKA